MFYGHYLEKPVKCFNCGTRWISHEEKRTDVNMAVEMLNDAHGNAFDTAFLISGDGDLAGLVRSIRQLFPQKWIVAIFPPARHSDDLRRAANASFAIGRRKLAVSQFPNEVISKSGYPLHRPLRWK